MNKVTMPEPSMYGLFNDDGQLFRVCGSDEEAINAALDAGGIVEIERYITTDQAEAYAQAVRREALEEAMSAIEAIQWPVGNSPDGELAATWTEEKLIEAREAIRALIQQEKKT